MNDECAHGAFAGCLFKFVGPASVVRQGIATEEFRVVRGRVADDAEDNFSFYVHACIVVPTELRCGRAIAHKNDGCIDVGVCGERLVRHYKVFTELQLYGSALFA